MRMKPRILALAGLAVAVAVIVSCGPPPVSISDRINMFVSDINSNPGNAYTDCDPAATGYGAANAAFWQAVFPQAPYTVSNLNDSNSAAVTVTFTGTGGPTNWTFSMVNKKNMGSDNWLIRTIKDSGGTTRFS